MKTRHASRRSFCCGVAAHMFCCLPGLRAQAELLKDQPLHVTEVATGLYVSQGVQAEAAADNLGAIANVAFIVGDEAVAVLDTGGCLMWGKRLREAIAVTTDRPIRYVVNSHVHPDHILGNAAFDAPTFIGHAKLPRALAARGAYYLRELRGLLGPLAEGTRVLMPTMTVEDRAEIDLGRRTLRLQAHPTAHTDNDLSVYDVRTSTLLLSDLLFVERTPAIDGSLKGWLGVIAALRGIEAARAVPGHGPAVVEWPSALDAEEHYFRTVRGETRAVLRKGGTMEEAVATVGGSERGKWLLFDDYHPRNVATAFAELEWE
jgi:quinoprotein relay system zinc metallohydrolase 2